SRWSLARKISPMPPAPARASIEKRPPTRTSASGLLSLESSCFMGPDPDLPERVNPVGQAQGASRAGLLKEHRDGAVVVGVVTATAGARATARARAIAIAGLARAVAPVGPGVIAHLEAGTLGGDRA